MDELSKNKTPGLTAIRRGAGRIESQSNHDFTPKSGFCQSTNQRRLNTRNAALAARHEQAALARGDLVKAAGFASLQEFFTRGIVYEQI